MSPTSTVHNDALDIGECRLPDLWANFIQRARPAIAKDGVEIAGKKRMQKAVPIFDCVLFSLIGIIDIENVWVVERRGCIATWLIKLL
jgi:hypothetical protein